jgi:chitinase
MRSRSAAAGLAIAVSMALFVVAPGTASAGDGKHGRGNDFKKVGYFIQWGIYGRGYPVKQLDVTGQAARLTHVNYAFGNVDSTARCSSGDPWADFQRPVPAEESVDGVADAPGQVLNGNFNQLRKLKAKYPNLKVNISLGGWTWSKYFSDAALTDASRKAFVQSCVDLFLRGDYGVFDGIDLDWEWPGSEGNAGNIIRPEDKPNFTLLLKEFRAQLDKLGKANRKYYELTAFLPASPAKIDAGFEVRKIFRYLDFATVQGYDFHGTWEMTTNHQSAIFSPAGQTQPDFWIDQTLDAWVGKGAPRRELVLGIPFYGQGWTGVANANNGLFQSATGPAPGVFGPGVEDYENLAKLRQQGYTVHRDLKAGHAWLFDGTTFWTFDDPLVIAQKMLYVRFNGYGGAMVWSLDGDDPNGTLIKTIDALL